MKWSNDVTQIYVTNTSYSNLSSNRYERLSSSIPKLSQRLICSLPKLEHQFVSWIGPSFGSIIQPQDSGQWWIKMSPEEKVVKYIIPFKITDYSSPQPFNHLKFPLFKSLNALFWAEWETPVNNQRLEEKSKKAFGLKFGLEKKVGFVLKKEENKVSDVALVINMGFSIFGFVFQISWVRVCDKMGFFFFVRHQSFRCFLKSGGKPFSGYRFPEAGKGFLREIYGTGY